MLTKPEIKILNKYYAQSTKTNQSVVLFVPVDRYNDYIRFFNLEKNVMDEEQFLIEKNIISGRGMRRYDTAVIIDNSCETILRERKMVALNVILETTK